MIELKLKLDNKDLRIFEPYNFKFANNIDTVIKRIATEIRNTAVTNISRGARHGAIYKRKTVTHQASAPGEYPKTDTGRLVASIRTNFRFLEADIGSDVNYSQFLETGTKYMMPRPWLQPSFDANEKKLQGYIDDALRRTFNP
jgi:HK97 gp10 family phage protein